MIELHLTESNGFAEVIPYYINPSIIHMICRDGNESAIYLDRGYEFLVGEPEDVIYVKESPAKIIELIEKSTNHSNN